MTVGLSAANTVSPWLNCIRASGTTRTVVSGTQVKIHTGDPGAAGTANVSVGDNTAKTLTQNASSNGSALTISGSNPQWTNGGTSETISHVSVWDTATFLYSITLTAPQAWQTGNTFTLTACGMSIAPQAA